MTGFSSFEVLGMRMHRGQRRARRADNHHPSGSFGKNVKIRRPANVDHRADLSPVGMVLDQMLTGKIPRSGFIAS
jgi:hypothetical protein